MSEESPQTWGIQGQPRPVVPELLGRLQMHSPDLYTQLRWYLDSNNESVDVRLTHDGTDASALLSLQLLETLMMFTQLRMEVMDQPGLSAVKGKIPGHIQLAISELMKLEPVLLQAATSAMQLHLFVWNAHADAAPWTPPEDEDKPEHRGRWVKDPKKNSDG